MTPLPESWQFFRCVKHDVPQRTTCQEVLGFIRSSECPCCPSEHLEVHTYQLGDSEATWLRCPCCGTDWMEHSEPAEGWLALPWTTRAVLITLGGLKEAPYGRG
jgi:transposase-like protein